MNTGIYRVRGLGRKYQNEKLFMIFVWSFLLAYQMEKIKWQLLS